MAKFVTGVIVQLKSGGPKMTCDEPPLLDDGEVHCRWFAGGNLKYGSFPSESLNVVDESENKKK